MSNVHNLHSAIEKYLLVYHTKDLFITVGYWTSTRVHVRIYFLKLLDSSYYAQNGLSLSYLPSKFTYTGHWRKALRYFPTSK